MQIDSALVVAIHYQLYTKTNLYVSHTSSFPMVLHPPHLLFSATLLNASAMLFVI